MKFVYKAGFVCLFLANILLLFCLRQNRQQVVSKEEKSILQLEKDCMFTYEHNHEIFPLKIKLFSIEGKETFLNEVIKNNTFVMWYPQHNCTLCFRESLEQFLAITKSEVNTLLLSTCLSPRDLMFFKKKYNITIPCFSIGEKQVDFPFKDIAFPIFFNLTTEGVVQNIWVHNPRHKNVADAYFQMQGRLFQ